MEEQTGIISGESKYGFRVDIIGQNIILTPVEEEHKYTLIWMHGLGTLSIFLIFIGNIYIGDSAFGHVDMFYKEKSMVPKVLYCIRIYSAIFLLFIEHKSNLANSPKASCDHKWGSLFQFLV